MFDFFTDKQTNKNKIVRDAVDPTTASSEDILPFESIRNGKVHMKDGSTVVYISYPGRNLSLITEKDKEKYAEANSKIFSGLTADEVSIFWIPEKTDSNAQLEMLRRRIAALEKEVADNVALPPALFKHKKDQLKLLKKHILASAERQALTAPTVQGKTYLGLKFNYQKEAEINVAVRNTCKRVLEATGKTPQILLSREEILDFIDGWLNASVPATRAHQPQIVLPKYSKVR